VFRDYIGYNIDVNISFLHLKFIRELMFISVVVVVVVVAMIMTTLVTVMMVVLIHFLYHHSFYM
jgi:hypothetical protein